MIAVLGYHEVPMRLGERQVVSERAARKLAAIVAADVVGYSRQVDKDEEGTIVRLKARRREIVDPMMARDGGRIVKTMGDGLLFEFPSVVDAVRNAIDVQNAMAEQNLQVPEDQRMQFRVGVNFGDIIIDGDDILGDGVIIAARLEGLCEPGGVCVTSDVYREVRGKVDANFVDLGQQSVKNMDEPIHVYGIDLGLAAPLSATVQEAEDILSRPSVAVLPFDNMSGDDEQEYFVDGLTEDIITALSKYRSFPVIARNSTFAYKGTSPDVREVGQQLGARYVLEGSARKGGNRVRVTAQLIDAENGHHVWADRYDRDLSDIFAVQDELTQGIAAVVVPQLERVAHKRLIAVTTPNLDAYDYVLYGLACLNAVNEEDNDRAEEMFRRAIDLDPSYGRAYAALAFAQHRVIMFEYSGLSEETLPLAMENAHRAIELDGSDFLAHWVMSALSRWSNDLDGGLAAAIRSVELNPSFGHGYNLVGLNLTFLGRPEEALPHFDTAIALCPNDPRLHIILAYTALAHYAARKYDGAVDLARKAIRLQPSYPDAYVLLAAGLAQLNRPDEARAAVEECERLRPGFISERNNWYFFRQAEDNQHLRDGLQKSGWQL